MYAEKPTIAAELANSLTAQDPSNVAFKLLAAATNAGASRSETARTHLASLQKISQELDESAPVNQEMIKILRDKNLISGTSVRKTYTGWRAIHASRPQHEALGSVLWQSIKAPNFEWTESDGSRHSLDEVAPNKPAIVTFVLGNCPRCDDQFALLDEKREELRAQGIELIAIASTPENIPAFKQMWSYDEFESIPIHGLFVINAQRDVVWQDINAEAFIDIDFLMKELPRSLSPLQPDMIKGTLSR
jgi:thiol-disulfide isomerase/thioredoxin